MMIHLTIKMKTFLFVVFSFILTPIFEFVEKYLFDDWKFLIPLCALVILDTLFGFMNAVRTKTVESRAWERVLKKIVLYAAVVIVGNLLTKAQIRGQNIAWFESVNYFLCTALMVREVLSLFEKWGYLGFQVPSWILARFKQFDDEGKIKPFENDSTTTNKPTQN